MKKKLVLLVAMCFMAVSFAFGQNNPGMQGTWKRIYHENSIGQGLPEGYTHVKFITPTHFMWIISDKQGTIITGAGGQYTFDGKTYVESLDYVLPSMKNYYGDKPSFQITFDGKRYTQKGKVGQTEFTETWERVD